MNKREAWKAPLPISRLLKNRMDLASGGYSQIEQLIRRHSYARMIGELEELPRRSQYLLEVTSLCVPLEGESRSFIRGFLESHGLSREDLGGVAFLVKNYPTSRGLEAQILREALLLADTDRAGLQEKAASFGTASGIALFEKVLEARAREPELEKPVAVPDPEPASEVTSPVVPEPVAEAPQEGKEAEAQEASPEEPVREEPAPAGEGDPDLARKEGPSSDPAASQQTEPVAVREEVPSLEPVAFLGEEPVASPVEEPAAPEPEAPADGSMGLVEEDFLSAPEPGQKGESDGKTLLEAWQQVTRQLAHPDGLEEARFEDILGRLEAILDILDEKKEPWEARCQIMRDIIGNSHYAALGLQEPMLSLLDGLCYTREENLAQAEMEMARDAKSYRPNVAKIWRTYFPDRYLEYVKSRLGSEPAPYWELVDYYEERGEREAAKEIAKLGNLNCPGKTGFRSYLKNHEV